MKEFKVKKNVTGGPYIIGLPLPLFYLFLIVVILNLFFQLSGFGMFRILISLLICGLAYAILKFFSGDTLDKLGNQKFPDSITIDKF